ncbi:MAG: FtsX-like permease family protein [Burkholderiaceae bacterium]|uniref:ABC transporter permease n=1 Tax=Ottowia sp. TaxID=1898956 RepID=UPI002B9C3BE5|nr:FtsX-like permease family protein [Ottowia sp.]MCP5258388.1 FtsX-like permease family protein [Burkholderiaceae bacterium]HRW72656.1 FtsX-like permease family protein [Ottowia sp.]
MKALDRKALRDLWHLRGQALAIALVIAAGIAMLVMSQATLDSLRQTRARLYQDYRFSDVWVQLKRAPDNLADRLADIPGVAEVETRVATAGKLQLTSFREPVEALLQSLPDSGQPRQNLLYLRAGRLPAPFAQDEVVVSDAFAEAHHLKPGERLRATVYGRAQWFTVVGIASSPEYLYQIKPGSMFPDYERYAIVWAHRRALAAALDMNGAFNQAVIKLAPGAHEQDVIDALDRLLARYGSRGATGRADQLSHHFLDQEFKQLATMARLFPAIFLGVAAFLLNVVFKRLIGTQRDQVAILKAFGYTTRQVALHYGLIVTLICLLGSAIGVGLGVWLGQHLSGLYRINFRFPFLDFHLGLPVMAAGIGISLLAALGGTGRAVYAAAGEPVAQAMRPPAPERYRRTLAERLGLTRWLSQAARIIWRQLERRPGKALLTVIGLALAGGILMMARFQTGSIFHMVDLEFRLAQQQDISASFVEPTGRGALRELAAIDGVRAVEGVRQVPVRLRHDNHSALTSIQGLPAGASLQRPVDMHLRRVALPPDGLVLGDYLAQRLGVKPGDLVWVEVLEGRQKKLQLPVVQLVQAYTGLPAYMDLQALNRALGDDDVVSGALLTVDAAAQTRVLHELDRRPRVAGAETRLGAVRAFFKSIAEFTGVFTWIAVLMGGVVNFGVVYNSARIALSERGRELASLRVLGLTQGEVSTILLGELALLVLVSIPLSFVVGWGLSAFLARGMQSDLYRVPVVLPPSSYAFAALITVLSAVLSSLAVYWRIRRLDLIGVLKTRE